MPTAEELLSQTSEVDRTLVIDGDLRTIIIPSTVKNLGVESDDEVLRLHFRMPGTYCGISLSAFKIRINYMNAKSEGDIYEVTDAKKQQDGTIEFSWLVGRHAVTVKGNVTFNVCLKDTDSTGKVLREFNTTIASLPVLQGLETGEQAIQKYNDIFEQWKSMLFGVGDTEEGKILAASEAQQAVIANKGAEAVSAVESKGVEILGQIPGDYKSMYAMADDSVRTKADAPVSTVEGETIFIADSAEDPLRGLKVFGKTTQVTTTGKNQVDMSEFEFNDSNYTHMLYASNSVAANSLYNFLREHTGESIVISMTRTGTASGIDIGSVRFYGEGNELLCAIVPNVAHTIIELPDAFTAAYIYGSTSGASVKNIQVEFGTEATEYEPYSGGVASPNPEYPQELANLDDVTVKIFGKNLIQNTVGKTTIAGVTYTPNSDGSITLNGTATDNSYYTFDFNNPIPAHNTELILSIEGGGGLTACTLGYFRADGTVQNAIVYAENNEVSFSYPDEAARTRTFLTVSKGKICNNVVVRPMVRLASADATFEAAKLAQSLSVTNVLNGIPISANGQQWVRDEVDFERGVYIQRVNRMVFNGSEAWRIGSNQYIYLDLPSDKPAGTPIAGFCSHFNYKHDYAANCLFATDRWIYLGRELSSSYELNVDTWKEFLSNNPMTVQYILATPIETPLTATEIEAFKKLYAHYPNTTVLNDSGAHMQVSYNTDTALYIARELENSVVAVLEAIANETF